MFFKDELSPTRLLLEYFIAGIINCTYIYLYSWYGKPAQKPTCVYYDCNMCNARAHFFSESKEKYEPHAKFLQIRSMLMKKMHTVL